MIQIDYSKLTRDDLIELGVALAIRQDFQGFNGRRLKKGSLMRRAVAFFTEIAQHYAQHSATDVVDACQFVMEDLKLDVIQDICAYDRSNKDDLEILEVRKNQLIDYIDGSSALD